VERDRWGCRRVVGYHQWHPDFELLEVSSLSDIEEKGGGAGVAMRVARRKKSVMRFPLWGLSEFFLVASWGVANFDYVKIDWSDSSSNSWWVCS
jgi:hypothetical protein